MKEADFKANMKVYRPLLDFGGLSCVSSDEVKKVTAKTIFFGGTAACWWVTRIPLGDRRLGQLFPTKESAMAELEEMARRRIDSIKKKLEHARQDLVDIEHRGLCAGCDALSIAFNARSCDCGAIYCLKCAGKVRKLGYERNDNPEECAYKACPDCKPPKE